MFYLLIAILFGSLFSVVFKLCQRWGIDTFYAIFFNYLTAFLIVWVPKLWTWAHGADAPVNPLNEQWLWMSAVQGFFFFYGFSVMSHSTRLSGVALTTVAARASLVLPVLASWLLLGQPAPAWLPVLLILVAMLLIVVTPSGNRGNSKRAWWFLVLVFVFYGISDFSLKLVQHAVATIHTGDELLITANLSSLTGSIFFFAMLFSLAAVLVKNLKVKRSRRKPATEVSGIASSATQIIPLSWREVVAGCCLGVVNMLCTSCMLRGLNVLSTDVYYPLYNIGIVIMGTLFGVLLFRERLRPLQYVGLLVAIAAIALFFL